MKVEKDFGKKREWLILTEEARWLLKKVQVRTGVVRT
mgnify:CR=1 FL=1